ncbi:MAG: hypothetical protein R3E97_02500 [Candidatus Eisenbacteria bacterium]
MSQQASARRHGMVGRIVRRLQEYSLAIGVGCVLVTSPSLTACSEADNAREAVTDAARTASQRIRTAGIPDAQTVVHRMLTCARAENWDAYVEFYAESDKLRTDKQRQDLIYRFRSQWSSRVLASLERADVVEPVIEGDRAVFSDDRGVAFVLYRMDDGHWGFRL